MLTLKLHYIIRINKRTLPCIALSLYLLQEMIYAIFSIALEEAEPQGYLQSL